MNNNEILNMLNMLNKTDKNKLSNSINTLNQILSPEDKKKLNDLLRKK